MLVTLEKIAKFPWSPILAQVQTPIGRTAVTWRGADDSPPGEYDVEWTVTEPVRWGVNAKIAATEQPGFEPGAHGVILRGILTLLEDGSASFDLGGSQILLDIEGTIPASVAGQFVDLKCAREQIELWPYEV